jgi:hypothetical protein
MAGLAVVRRDIEIGLEELRDDDFVLAGTAVLPDRAWQLQQACHEAGFTPLGNVVADNSPAWSATSPPGRASDSCRSGSVTPSDSVAPSSRCAASRST